MSFVKSSNAPLYLLFNAFLWGSSYVWSKMLLGYMPRFFILFLCSLGGLAATTAAFFPQLKNISLTTIRKSAFISSASIISNTFFIFALQYTSSSNAAFIVQMSVIFTPILTAFIDRKKPEPKVILCAVIALAGLFLLTIDTGSLGLRLGDLLAMGNALFFSVFLTSQKCNSEKINPVHFTFAHHATNSIAFLGISLLFERKYISIENINNPVFLVLIAASIFITAATILIQSAAIRYVKSDKAILLYTFEPVAALLLAAAVLGERPEGTRTIAGSIIILIAVVYSIYTPGIKEKTGLKPSKGIVFKYGSLK